MHKEILITTLALGLSFTAVSANALDISYSYTVGQYESTQAGAQLIDFGVSPVNDSETTTGTLPSTDLFSYSGGGLFNTDLIRGYVARPFGATDNFWSTGVTGNQASQGMVTFEKPVSYYGFLWASPDTFNTVAFYSGSILIGSFDGSAVKQPADGDQSYSAYFNVTANENQLITKVLFTSTNNAFETDNHAFVFADQVVSNIPENQTFALLLSGLFCMSFMARRENKTTKNSILSI